MHEAAGHLTHVSSWTSELMARSTTHLVSSDIAKSGMSARDAHRDATPTSTSTPDGTTSTRLNTLRTCNSSPWLRTARHRTGCPVLRRRLAQHCLEVFDEVRLVEVTQLRRQLCPRCSGVPFNSFRRLL